MLKNFLKKYNGAVPFVFISLCGIVLVFIDTCTNCTLRVVPRNILMGLEIISLGIFLVWINFKILPRKLNNTLICVLSKVVSSLLFVGVVMFSAFVMVFSYTPEHVVVRNDIKMVARVRSFLDVCVDYYQYENTLFAGKKLGYEYYGSGGYDPFEYEEELEPYQWIFYDEEGNVVDEGFRDRYSEE